MIIELSTFIWTGILLFLIGLLGGYGAGRSLSRSRLTAACKNMTELNKLNAPDMAAGARWALAEVYSWCIKEVSWLHNSRKRISEAPGSLYKKYLEKMEADDRKKVETKR